MTKNVKTVSHKLGANRGDIAKKAKKRDSNFAQSRDIHEDRGQRQIKNGPAQRTL
jgi:hypothetical protein